MVIPKYLKVSASDFRSAVLHTADFFLFLNVSIFCSFVYHCVCVGYERDDTHTGYVCSCLFFKFWYYLRIPDAISYDYQCSVGISCFTNYIFCKVKECMVVPSGVMSNDHCILWIYEFFSWS